MAVGLAAGLGVKLAATLIAAPPTLGGAAALALVGLVGVEFADFGSGVYHWSMDNYGDARTPIFGKQIEAFQGHHERPWTITHRQTCNNLSQPAIAGSPVLLLFLLFAQDCWSMLFGLTAMTLIILSQELHKWAHSPPGSLPRVPAALQAAGLTIGTRGHLAHHKPPFNNNYCIVTGHCNKLLDSSGFFPTLERLVFELNGVRPRSWTEERFEFDALAKPAKRRSST